MSITKGAIRSPKKPESGKKTRVAARKPLPQIPGEESLVADLEKYRQMAIDLGAMDALVVPASDIPQDIRVWWRCQIPRCVTSGANAYCPPQWRTPWQDAKRIKNSYKYGIVILAKRTPEFWTGPRYLHALNNAVVARYLPDKQRQQALSELDEWLERLDEFKSEYKSIPKDQRPAGTASIGPRIVQKARSDGHNFAVTFGVGTCQQSRCAKYGTTCVALTTGLCRFPGKACPEGSAAMYQDFSALSAKMGWKTYVSGYCVWAEDASEVEYFQFGTILVE